jgi:hypothetical protein
MKPWRNACGCPPTRRPEPMGDVPKPWRRKTCFGGFRRRYKRDHGCPAFVAETTSAEQAKAVGLHVDRSASVSFRLPARQHLGGFPPPLVTSALARSGPAQCCFGSVPTQKPEHEPVLRGRSEGARSLEAHTGGGQEASADLAGAAGPHQASGAGKPELTTAPWSDDRGHGNSGRLPLQTAVEGELARGAEALAPCPPSEQTTHTISGRAKIMNTLSLQV